MIGLATIGAITAGVSALGGAIGSAVANNKARKLISNQRDTNEKWWDVKRNEDYTQRADALASINAQRDLLTEQYDRARKTSAVMGGTDEAVAMQRNAANNSLSATLSNMAAQGAQAKDSAEAQYRATDNALAQQQAQSYVNQGQAIASAAGQATNAGINLMGLGAK